MISLSLAHIAVTWLLLAVVLLSYQSIHSRCPCRLGKNDFLFPLQFRVERYERPVSSRRTKFLYVILAGFERFPANVKVFQFLLRRCLSYLLSRSNLSLNSERYPITSEALVRSVLSAYVKTERCRNRRLNPPCSLNKTDIVPAY